MSQLRINCKEVGHMSWYINCVNREPDDSEEDKDTLTIFLRSMVTVIISSGKQELK